MLQVYSNSSNPFNSSAQGDLIFGTGGANDVELVANLYKTRTNILKIINKVQFKYSFLVMINILAFQNSIFLMNL